MKEQKSILDKARTMLAVKWAHLRPILTKATTLNLQPTEASFPELPDVLVWLRFALAVAYGLSCGIRVTRSPVLPLQAFNLICFIPILYTRYFLGLNSDAFGSKIIFAGTFQSLALFMLIWIYCFTAAHSEEEAHIVSNFLIQKLSSSSSTFSDVDSTGSGRQEDIGGGGAAGGGGGGGGAEPVVEESEF